MKEGKFFFIGAVVVAFTSIFVMAFQTIDTDKLAQFVNTPSYLSGVEQGITYKSMTAYQVDQTDPNCIYMRFKSGAGTVLVLRITTAASIITYEKATGTWANRATLTYTGLYD